MAQYSEHAFQQAWSGVALRLTGLRSDMGQHVDIIDAGRWNHLSGPDFLDAKVLIDGKLFRGGIELHLKPGEWYTHGHHLDSAYDCVVLHASPMPARRAIVRSDGTRIPHVSLERSMPSWLPAAAVRENVLACAGKLQSNLDALLDQLKSAASCYFEELAERHLSLVRCHHEPTEETLRSIFIRSCSVLGAPANRETMAEAAAVIWDNPQIEGATELMQLLTELAWRHNCGRPASRPHNRMRQALVIRAALLAIDTGLLNVTDPSTFMREHITPAVGATTGKVIFTTVLLPALWVHATMSGNSLAASSIREKWDDTALPPSPAASNAFGGVANQIPAKYRKALTWQHRNLCSFRNCASCKVGIRMLN